jgi:hypothetical protein
MGEIGPQRRRYEVLPDPSRGEDVRERRELESSQAPAKRPGGATEADRKQ